MRSLFLFIALFMSALCANSQMSGTYTIDGGNPTSGSNFASFTAAFSALNASGVSGAVTLNVVANSGPYNEQVSLDSVNNLSATNTLTLNGNGNLLYYTTTSSYKQVLKINGCPYVTINDLAIKANSLSDAVGIHVLNGSHHSTVKNCVIDLDSVTASSSTDVVGICVNGAEIWTFGNGTTDHVTVENNTVYGGLGGVSTGIKCTGGGFPATYSEGHIVRNNKVFDARFWGISIEYSDSSFVMSNEVSRPTMTTGDFGGIAIFSGATRVVVDGNKIHNTHDASVNFTKATGIYVNNATPTSANRNRIQNNLIYNFNGNGENIGLFCFSSNNVDFYHNTVSFDHTTATVGNTYGYFQQGALSNINVINNIFSITRGGSGPKFAYYFQGGSAPSIVANNNVLYMNSNGSGGQNIAYWNSTNYQTLTNWQAANSGVFDTNSVDSDPGFVSISGNNYHPSSLFVDNIGQALSNVPFDIDGIPRSVTTPDPGAYETAPPPLDAGIVSIDSLFATCPDTVEVYATLKNFGLDTLKSANIGWKVNGSLQGTLSLVLNLPVQQSISVYLGNVNLLASSSLDIEVYSSMPNGQNDTINANDTSYTYNYRTALSGTYTVGNTGDYLNLMAAVTDLNDRGICGSVLFNVDSTSGPFTNQLLIYEVKGSSFTDTVVFEGNNAEIDLNLSGKDLYSIKLESASHITFQNFNLSAIGNPSKDGGAFFFTNGANYNRIQNCYVDYDNVIQSSFNTGAVAMLSGASATSVASFNVIENCEFTVWGLRNGICVRGQSGVLGCYGNQFKNNVIRNIYSCGIYLSYADSTLIYGNDISRIDQLVGWAFTGVRLHLDNQNTQIERNRIHNPFDQDLTKTTQAIGIDVNSCDAPLGKENKITNNLIYNFNGLGLHIGINNENSSGMHCYHNTIVLDFSNAQNDTYGFHQRFQASNIDIRNNLIYINRAGNFSKFAYSFQTANSNIISDNNAIYVDTNDTKAYVSRRGNFNFRTLDAWVNSPFSYNNDLESAFDQPRFADPASDLYIPFSCRFNNIGADSLGVEMDILDSIRDILTPDPGAHEFDVSYDLVDAGQDTVVCIDKNFTLTASSGFSSYAWSTGGDSKSESIFALDLGYGDTLIYVTASDSIGCESTDAVKITVEDCIPDGILDNLSSLEAHVFPNPVSEVLNVQFSKSLTNELLEVIIYTLEGKEVKSWSNFISENKYLQLSVSELQKGTYFIHIINQNEQLIKTFIKQ